MASTVAAPRADVEVDMAAAVAERRAEEAVVVVTRLPPAAERPTPDTPTARPLFIPTGGVWRRSSERQREMERGEERPERAAAQLSRVAESARRAAPPPPPSPPERRARHGPASKCLI